MKSIVAIIALLAASWSVVAGDALDSCYRQAETQKDYQQCLNSEYELVRHEYDRVVERVMTEARGLDRVQRKKTAAKAFMEANKSFLNYVEKECDWVSISHGAKSAGTNAKLACRINQLRIRTGALEAQFLSEEK